MWIYNSLPFKNPPGCLGSLLWGTLPCLWALMAMHKPLFQKQWTAVPTQQSRPPLCRKLIYGSSAARSMAMSKWRHLRKRQRQNGNSFQICFLSLSTSVFFSLERALVWSSKLYFCSHINPSKPSRSQHWLGRNLFRHLQKQTHAISEQCQQATWELTTSQKWLGL